MRMLLAIAGIGSGGIVSVAIIWFTTMPLVQKANWLPLVLLVGMVCGLLLGLRLDTLRRRRQENYGIIPPKAQDAKPDDTIWPPPPAPPTEK